MRLCGLISPCLFRRYLPVLRGFPAKYIYDPWNAPNSVQTAAKCIIGVHYPKPMVNHAEASRLNIERMKQIYQQLSRYRGLGLLASVPSTHNGNGNGMAYSPGEQQSGSNTPAPTMSGSSVAGGNRSGSILLNFDIEEHQGPNRIKQQQKLGHVTCKRERGPELDTEENDTLATSHKLQRQIKEISTVHGTNGDQPEEINGRIKLH